MKRIAVVAILFIAMHSAYADEEDFYGMITTLSNATEVEDGQLYALYSQSSKRFLCDDGSEVLAAGYSPELSFTSSNTGTLLTLEAVDGGGYHLRTGLGNYLGELTVNEATPLTATPQAIYTLEVSQSDASSWTLSNNGIYLNGNMQGSSNAGNPTVWTAYTVKLCGESELTPQQRLTFQETMLQSGTPVLARLSNAHNTDRYLTTNGSGVACGATLISETDYSQIWLITALSGGGYTFRNADTGEFLTDKYSVPGVQTTLYIQEDPDNGDAFAYYNIASSSSFSGTTCLNLGNDKTTLYEWSGANGDMNSAWAFNMVYEVTLDDVVEHISSNIIYADELTDGAYYRIINPSYGLCIAEASGALKCVSEDKGNYSQYWQLVSDGDEWQIRNVLSDNYVQRQTALSNQYKTAEEPATFCIIGTGVMLENSWYICNTSEATRVLHCNSSMNVVAWYTSAAESKWQFLEVVLTEEEIEAAKEEYAEYNDVVENRTAIQLALDNLFEDKSCTTLQSGVSSLTDDELELNEDYKTLTPSLKRMVMKVKNDTWDMPTATSSVTDSYEKFFRIADYRPYSHYSKMANGVGQRYSYAKLSGPTGISASGGDALYLFVSETPEGDCNLQVEMVTIDGSPDGHKTGTTTSLSAGMNVVRASEHDMVYIFYQLNDTSEYLADYPDVKIHIEGGTVHGYWDATRSMTNRDWANMKEMGMLSNCEVINLKTEHLVFNMVSEPVLKAVTASHVSAGDELEDIEKLMRIWDLMCANEEGLQGLDEFDGRLRNVWSVFSMDHDYMYATTYGTYYNESTISLIMDYYGLTHMQEGNEGDPLWGPSHEIGHCHESLINVVSHTEGTANVYADINLFDQGVSTTRFGSPMLTFDNYLANGTSWLDKPEDARTPMFVQLYLYFHVMGHDVDFYPKLFKALRADPMDRGVWDSSLQADSDGDGVNDVTGGYKCYGKNDYLHFAKKVCDVAQADLSEFFEAQGMFVPIENKYLYDYGNYFVTTSQDDIDEACEYMRKYEKKLGNIMFIDDHIERKLADPDNKFEAVPASDGYKVNCRTEDGYKVGTAGDMGDYEQFDGHSSYSIDNDYYTMHDDVIMFHGTGCVGHKVYDLDGNLVWACTANSTAVPVELLSLFPDNVVVVGAEQNMADVPCPFYRSGSYPVYVMQVSFPDGVTNQWRASGNIDAYLPANAIAVLGKSDAPESLTSSVNVVDVDSTAQLIVIDGDLQCHIPQNFSAVSLSFTKSGTGFQALTLPFPLADATTVKGNAFLSEDVVPAGQPVVVDGDVAISLSCVDLTAGDFTVAESGNILASNGLAVEEAIDITPFVYLFDSTFEIGEYDSINEILSSPNADVNAVYDLCGRRLSRVNKPGVYIVNGVKMLLK